MSDIKYILLKNDKIIFCNTISDISKQSNLSISSIRRRREYSNKLRENIYLYTNIDPLSKYDKKNIFYLLISNDFSDYSFYVSLKDVAEKNSFDYSSLCKLLKNKNYKSIGGYNKGRKGKESSGKKGYSIFVVTRGLIPGHNDETNNDDEEIVEETKLIDDNINLCDNKINESKEDNIEILDKDENIDLDENDNKNNSTEIISHVNSGL